MPGNTKDRCSAVERRQNTHYISAHSVKLTKKCIVFLRTLLECCLYRQGAKWSDPAEEGFREYGCPCPCYRHARHPGAAARAGPSVKRHALVGAARSALGCPFALDVPADR